MITFPIAKLPGNHRKFIGVRSASNDMMMHGLFLRDDLQEDYMRVTAEQAEEICRQLCEERRKLNAEHEARRFPHEELTARQPPTRLEKLETVARVAAACCIDLNANLASAHKEYMAGEIPHGAYCHVLNRHGSIYLALHEAGFTAKHPLFDYPVQPEPETANEPA